LPPAGDFADSIDDELVSAVEHAFASAPSYGEWFAEKSGRRDIIHGLFRAFDPVSVHERTVVFDCPCSQERFRNSIISLGADEVADIKNTGEKKTVEAVCHNCGSVYNIPKDTIP
jgi:molecular chaperone Hsp33